MIHRHFIGRRLLRLGGARSLIILALLTGCGDPGTGGSGVPSGASSGAAAESPAAGAAGNLSAPTASPVTDTSALPAGQTSSGAIQSVAPVGVSNATASPASVLIVVNATRFEFGPAALLGGDGLARSADRLLPGVPVTLRYPANADLGGAAVNGSGPAVVVSAVIITDPLTGVLSSGPAGVLLDDGRSVALAPQVVIAGAPNGNARVRAWLLPAADGSLSVSRYEFE